MKYDRSSHYFPGGGPLEKTLRFLNLLEPKHMVLSLSKLSMYATFCLVVYVAKYHSADLVDLISALGSFGSAVGNYGYRRFKQYEAGDPPYPKTVDTVSDEVQDRALDQVK